MIFSFLAVISLQTNYDRMFHDKTALSVTNFIDQICNRISDNHTL